MDKLEQYWMEKQLICVPLCPPGQLPGWRVQVPNRRGFVPGLDLPGWTCVPAWRRDWTVAVLKCKYMNYVFSCSVVSKYSEESWSHDWVPQASGVSLILANLKYIVSPVSHKTWWKCLKPQDHPLEMLYNNWLVDELKSHQAYKTCYAKALTSSTFLIRVVLQVTQRRELGLSWA